MAKSREEQLRKHAERSNKKRRKTGRPNTAKDMDKLGQLISPSKRKKK